MLAFGGERGWNCLIVWSIGLMNLIHGLSNIWVFFFFFFFFLRKVFILKMSISSFFFNKKKIPQRKFFWWKISWGFSEKIVLQGFWWNYHEFCFENSLKKIISHVFLFWKALKTLFCENPFGNKFWNQFVWQTFLKLIEKYNSTKSFWCKTMDLQC